MTINSVSEAQQTQPTRRIETRKGKNGESIKCIFEDRNGDGKLDLYKIIEVPNTYDGSKHEFTYTDLDGDGYFDTKQIKVTGLTEKDVTEEYTEKNEATKMQNVLNPMPKIQKGKGLPIHFDIQS
jgi:hypothetical protein